MSVLTAPRIMEMTDTRLRRIVHFYVRQALGKLDLKKLSAFGPNETVSKRGHNYFMVFIEPERTAEPVIFATPGKGKETVQELKRFMENHGGDADSIVAAGFDMSEAFLSAAED